MWIVMFFVGAFSLLFQIGLWPGLFPSLYPPEIHVAAIVTLALVKGRKEAVVYGAMMGLFLDLYFGFSPGGRLLLYTAIGYCIGSFRENFVRKSWFANTVVAFLSTCVFFVLYPIVLSVAGESITWQSFLDSFFSHDLPVAVLFSFLYYWIFSTVASHSARSSKKDYLF